MIWGGARAVGRGPGRAGAGQGPGGGPGGAGRGPGESLTEPNIGKSCGKNGKQPRPTKSSGFDRVSGLPVPASSRSPRTWRCGRGKRRATGGARWETARQRRVPSENPGGERGGGVGRRGTPSKYMELQFRWPLLNILVVVGSLTPYMLLEKRRVIPVTPHWPGFHQKSSDADCYPYDLPC